MPQLTYFILTRKIFDSAIWRDDPHVLKLFIYLIGQARHHKTPKKYPTFKVRRGELVTSLSMIAENNEYNSKGAMRRWSRMKVSRMIKTLEKQGYVKILCDTYGTHISICNYDTYQTTKNYSVTGALQDCYGSVTEVLPYNNDNNVKNGKNVYQKPDLVNDQIWKDFLTLRKTKKATITETVMKKIISESKKANITLEKALQIMIEKNWQGFNADWIKDGSEIQEYK